MHLQYEHQTLEYKQDKNKTFLKTVSAFANEEGGTIVFGVSDQLSILGIQENLLQFRLDIENMINDNIHPVPVYTLSMDEKNRLVYLSVEESPNKPYRYKGQAYTRHDTATIPLDTLSLNRLVLEGLNLDYEETSSLTQTLDFQTLSKALETSKDIHLDQNTLKTLLLYSDKHGYNKAGELIADKNNYNIIDIALFEGNNEDAFKRRLTLQNISIIDAYLQSIDFFSKEYTYEVIQGSKRHTVEKIPLVAFREALANALIHRAWDIPAFIRISMFTTHISIISPGGLMDGLIAEDYINGKISLLRNPKIANVFYLLKYIEKFGTGIRRIKTIYRQNTVQPSFNISPQSIEIVLPIIDEQSEPLSEREQQILDTIKAYAPINRKDIEDKTQLKKDNVLRTINQLITKNLIQKSGKGRSITYQIKNI